MCMGVREANKARGEPIRGLAEQVKEIIENHVYACDNSAELWSRLEPVLHKFEQEIKRERERYKFARTSLRRLALIAGAEEIEVGEDVRVRLE